MLGDVLRQQSIINVYSYEISDKCDKVMVCNSLCVGPC